MNKDIKVLLIALLLTVAVLGGVYYGLKLTEGTVVSSVQQGTPGHPAM